MSEFLKYLTEQEVVEAVQVTADGWPAIYGLIYVPSSDAVGHVCNPNGDVTITTRDGTMTARIGDWIIRAAGGKMSICQAAIFAMIYKPVSAEREATNLVERLRELRDLSGLARSSYTLALGEAADEIERLRAEVDKQPKTFDGVPVLPEMNVWVRVTISDAPTKKRIVYVAADSVLVEGSPETDDWVFLSSCYSTREAASAAGGKK